MAKRLQIASHNGIRADVREVDAALTTTHGHAVGLRLGSMDAAIVRDPYPHPLREMTDHAAARLMRRS